MTKFRKAALFSDLDGTVVAKLSNKHPWRWPQNLAKYPLAIIPDWGEFVHGALGVDGVHFRGIVSRRPDVRPRRKVTELSLGRTALDPDLVGREHLAGSEKAKAKVLTDAAQENLARVTVGMIEDMPQKLVPELVRELEATAFYPDLNLPKPRIIVGVVDHPKAQQRIEGVVAELDQMEKRSGRSWDGFYYGVRVNSSGDGGLHIGSGKMDIDVVPLPKYSTEAGAEFGERLAITPIGSPQPTY